MTTHTAVPQPGTGFPPFQRDTFASQLVWLALSFVLLYVLLARIGLPRVASILASRRRHIESLLSEANVCKTKSEHSVAEYQRARGNIREEAEALIQGTQRRVQTEARQARDALERELNAQVAAAERSISTTRSDALANLRSVAIETSELVVASLSGAVPREGAAARAVDRVLEHGGQDAR